MRKKTPRRLLISCIMTLCLFCLSIAQPAVAESPVVPLSPSDAPTVVDGTHLPELQDISRRVLKDIPATARTQVQSTRPTPPLGTVVNFWSWDFLRGQFHQLAAVLERVGPTTEIYVEQGYTIPATILDAIVQTAEANTLRERQAFGMEPNPGIDGNPRTTILLLDIRDSYFYGRGPYMIGGYFWALNQYPQAVLDAWYGGRYKSNEREMIFVDLLATLPGTSPFYQIMAHEFQHLIHWNHDPDEDQWLNEGLSNLAAHLTGHGMPASHVRAFLRQPNRSLTRTTGDALGDYGGQGLFSLFLWEHYGGDTMSRLLVDSQANGVTSIDSVLARLGYQDRFTRVLSHWAVANYLDDPTVYGYHSLDIVEGLPDTATVFARPRLIARHEVYPTGPLTLTIASLGAEYVALGSLERGDLVITLTAGSNANFLVNVITSTSSTFATGTNVLREVAIAAGRMTAVVIPGAGQSYTNVLLVPVNVSESASVGTLVYQAVIITSTTVEPPTPPSDVQPPQQPPTYSLRINAGGQSYTDSNNLVWEADRAYTPGGAGYVGGQSHIWSGPISQTPDPALYQTERWGLRAYKFDVPNGTYRVTLRFSEGYFTSAGRRVFNVQIEGQTVLPNFDIFRVAGGRSKAYDCSFTTEVRDGQLVIAFIPLTSEPAINAIAVEMVGP